MKKSFLILLACLINLPVSGQEKYFHDLRGMEDSNGVTHLFYRMHHRYIDEYPCGDNSIEYVRYDNNIFHFNTSANQDSVLFEQYATEYCGGYNYFGIFDFTFKDQNPDKWIKGEVSNSKYSIEDKNGQSIEFYLPVPTTKSTAKYREYFPIHFFLNNSQDSLFINTEYGGTLKFPGKSNEWPKFEDHIEYFNYTDSVVIEWDIIAQHPFYDSLYFARGIEFRDSSLYRSENSIVNFSLVSSGNFSRQLKFDGDSTHIYSLKSEGIFRSDELGVTDTWDFIEIDFQTSAPRYLTITENAPGELIISDSTVILFSENHGNSFSEFLSVENEITGLYKKPNSNILYVLTRKELLEVNTETKQTITLKQLPVSSEQSPDIPIQISLEQNYPNPFNPSTVISYQLNSNQLVQ
ncbi:MAG: hypothetical protein WD361_03945, partial [Gracilimonas sp.]